MVEDSELGTFGEAGNGEGESFPRVSPDELRQLEERARMRLNDPNYRRRVQATDQLVNALLKNHQ